jgi:hypothetical protein
MKLTLEAETVTGWSILADPAVVPRSSELDPVREAQRGNLIAHYFGVRGGARFIVTVDEPIDASLAERGSAGELRPHNGVLRVPSGRLAAADTHSVATATSHPIPAGVYEVTALEVSSEELERAADDARAASPSGSTAETVLGTLLGILVVATLLAGLLAVLMMLLGKLSLRHLGWGTAIAAVPWTLTIAAWKLSGASRASRAREISHEAFPTALIHLRRLPDGTDVTGREGVVLGRED